VQLWTEILDAWTAVSRSGWRQRIPKTLPVLIVAGQCDPVSQRGRRIEPMLAAYRGASLQGLEYHIYPGARHECSTRPIRDESPAMSSRGSIALTAETISMLLKGSPVWAAQM
jgi:alpha-beta hydrolase superfamily lysophospholipase